MSLGETLKNVFHRNKAIEYIFDFDLISESSQRAYLKKIAVGSVSSFVGRVMSTMHCRFTESDGTFYSPWDYILNVRPNSDMSATLFWQKFTTTLIKKNEVLVILTDDNQLLIADDFYRERFAIFEDYFKDVTVKDYTFKRTFKMSDVWYLEYNDSGLDSFVDGLFNDYGELFGRVMEVSMRNNQIRGSMSVDATGNFNNEKDENGLTQIDKIQSFISKTTASIKKNSVAIIPKMKGFEYEEYTNKQGTTNQPLKELDEMKKSLINDIARWIGVPSALVHGEMADLKFNKEAFRDLCVEPLISKIEDELNAKILDRSDYEAGKAIKVTGVLKRNILDYATQTDKLASGGTFIADEIREEFDKKPLPNGQGKKLRVTKNYGEVRKGGEETND